MEDQRTILSNKLIIAGQENQRLQQQSQKVESELVNLRKELQSCTSEKVHLAGKLKMALAKLGLAKASINRMNIRSLKLNEILGCQKSTSSKTGLGYVHGVSSSKDKGKSTFIQGPTMTAMPPTYSNATHPNYNYKRYVPKPNFVPIRPHYNKLRNYHRNQQRKHYVSPQQVKTRTIWIHKSDLRCHVIFTALSAQESDVRYLTFSKI